MFKGKVIIQDLIKVAAQPETQHSKGHYLQPNERLVNLKTCIFDSKISGLHYKFRLKNTW